MSCRSAHRRLSAQHDGELPPPAARALARHLEACPPCSRRAEELRAALQALQTLPRLEPPESIAASVRACLEVEQRGPGLALLFRPAWAARPLMLPSLAQALPLALAAALALALLPTGSGAPLRVPLSPPVVPWNPMLPAVGTEGNPLGPADDVRAPRRADWLTDDRDGWAQYAAAAGLERETSAFFETVVARDGSVAEVTLLGGDARHAEALLDTLRRERFEPARYRGRPVAVAVYRLVSRTEVRAPRT